MPNNTLRLFSEKPSNTFVAGLAQAPMVLKLIFALLAGGLSVLALAPYSIVVFVFVAPAMLYALLLTATRKQALLLGWSYGVGLWFVGGFWLFSAINDYSNTPYALGILMIFGMAVIMGLFHAFATYMLRALFAITPLSFAAVWALQEWLKTWLFTGFPWLFSGYAFTNTFVDSYAPIFGVLFLSFVAVYVAASFIELLGKKILWSMLSVLLIGASFGLQNFAWTEANDSKPLQVSLVQGNIPQDVKWLTEYRNKTLQIYQELTQPLLEKSDLVVWPESAIPMFQTEAKPFIEYINEQAKQTNTSWIFGIPYVDMQAFDASKDTYAPFYNSLIATGGNASGQYFKQRLVPFGEYIPFEGKLRGVLPDLARGLGMMSFSKGSEQQGSLNIKGNKLSSAICYEVAYPDLTRKNALGSDYMITVSNDAWFGTSDGPLQHLQMVQMRAREVGRWFIRATNNGVTAFINERGQIVAQAPRFERTTLTHALPSFTGNTPYMLWGNNPLLALCTLLLLIHFILGLTRRRR